MSVTVEISGKQAVLANGRWRSADPVLQRLLETHLATLDPPAHLPPQSIENLIALAAVKDLAATIVTRWPIPGEPDAGRMPDGRLKVF